MSQSDETDRELTEADLLLRKADALLHRYKPVENPADDDDLPLVTDIVEDTANYAPEAEAPDPIALAERLIDLDTAISRAVEEWIAREVPQLIEREIQQLGSRLRMETLAHARATLLPKLSEQIAVRLTEVRDLRRRP